MFLYARVCVPASPLPSRFLATKRPGFLSQISFSTLILFERAAQMGPVLGRAMHHNLKGLPHVVGIRSLGLAAAVELSPSSQGVGQRGYIVFQECLRRGVLVRSAGDNLVFAPPFIVEREHIEHMVATLADVIAGLAA